ncbi:hypothetical protein JCM10207_007824 [Rhodosporidiobolus poonsookiae]
MTVPRIAAARFTDLPVELAKRILLLAAQPPRPSKPLNQISSSTTLSAVSRTARPLYHLAQPLLWHTLYLHTREQAAHLISLPENARSAALFQQVQVVHAVGKGGIGLRDVFEVVKRLSDVRKIRLDHFFWNVGFGLEELAHRERLATLELSDLRLSDSSVQYSLPHLTSLSLRIRTSNLATEIPFLLSRRTLPSLRALYLGDCAKAPFPLLCTDFVKQLDVLAFPLAQVGPFRLARHLHDTGTPVAVHADLAGDNLSMHLFPVGACPPSLSSTAPPPLSAHLYLSLDGAHPELIPHNLRTLTTLVHVPLSSSFFGRPQSLHLPLALCPHGRETDEVSEVVGRLVIACAEKEVEVRWHDEEEEAARAVSPAVWRHAREVKAARVQHGEAML